MVFLDPEPRRFHNTRKRNASGTSFFSAQKPLDNPRDSTGNKYAWRKPLEERTRSQNNQQFPRVVPSSPAKTTVRIVEDSPTLLGSDQLDKAGFDLKTPSVDKLADEGDTAEHVLAATPRQSESREAKPANVRDPGSSVSSPTLPANEVDFARNDTLPATGVHARGSRTWHRRSGSTGNFSTSSTLKEGDSSLLGGQSVGSRSRLSQGTTLRGTPTPYEQDQSELPEAEHSTHALQTLEETSPERSTVRAVPSAQPVSPQTESDHQRDSQATQSSPIVRLLGRSSPTDYHLGSPSPPDRTSRRTSSTGSLPSAAYLRDISIVHYPRAQSSQDSLAPSDASLPTASSPNFAVFPSDISIPRSSIPPSSPNFIAFHSDASRPRSRSRPLRGVSSFDSIASRLQPSSRPGTASAYPDSSSSTDTLPPLQLPKKRLRHKPASASLGTARSASGAQGSNMVTEEEIDTLPYPRYQFSSHLSTIASESDRRSSQPLSHFSLGSGVSTIDDGSSIPLSSRRRGSAPMESIMSSREPDSSSGEHEDAGDMTLGLFREESAKPQPLFENKRYDGPLPPLPPIPPSRDSDENWDTVSELQAPVLREQRSGYSLRTRSNSTPSHSQSRRSQSHSRHLSQISYVSSDRGSHGSSIFPVWAKQFYQHNVPLVSSSKISLGPLPPRPTNPHLRNDSQRTERSITSRLGTGYSEIDNGGSPTSSHFLPSIFRPRTRGRSHGKKLSRSKGRPSGDSSRPDSMGIFADPLPQDPNAETTEAGQPKYGELKDESHGSRRPLPRKYSKQRQWNDMTFPRPMTKDRLSDFGMHMGEPRLGPSKRVSNRLSIWRAPSFVESLDSLVRSRANRQILLFAIGFVLPFSWMLAAVLPIPKRPISASDLEESLGGSEDDVAAAMMKHEAGDAEKRWRDEKIFLKARWWRSLNRIMSVVGLLVIGAVVSSCSR